MSKKMNKLQLSLFEDAVAVIEMPPAFIAQKTPLAQEIEVALEPKSVRDLFVLRDEYLNGVAGDRSKVDANLAAIEIVKSATAAGRKLTLGEKSRVAAYSGWGGLSDVFAQNTKYPAQQARLQELLGPQAYASAMESVLSAYYTEPAVIRSIWEMVRNMGFEAGRVLEPSCGVGHFIGAMPQEMRQQSKVVMVEIDEITAAMAGLLYADAETAVYPTGLQSAPVRPESFDLVVGNVPFGNYRVHDKRFDHLRANIHDYFFAKCLDALRPGGIMCLITSTWTMDKSESRMRQYLSERANLLTAIRLPSVVGVSDGDTVTILTASKERVKVRLAEIDAPESKQSFGARSKQSLSEICFGKQAVFSRGNSDRYGRVISRISCNGIDAQAHQVKNGMAWVYEKYASDKKLYGFERDARSQKKGLWSESNPVPPWDFRRDGKPLT